jgi:ribosomal protein S18 acetylase RimI-like enzyme
MRIEPVTDEHVEAVAALCEREGWETWVDRDRARRALTAPGADAVVAVEEGRVVGAAQTVSDGAITTYLGMLLVDPSQRGRGIGRMLVDELFARSGSRRMDLLAVEEAVGFYERLSHRRYPGFRLYPEAS